MNKKNNFIKTGLNSFFAMCIFCLVVPISSRAEQCFETDMLAPKLTIQPQIFQNKVNKGMGFMAARMSSDKISKGIKTIQLENARKEGRLFFLEIQEINKEIFTLRDDSSEEVAEMFLNTKQYNAHEAVQLRKRLEDPDIRRKLFKGFWGIRMETVFHEKLNDLNYGVILENPEMPTYLAGPNAKGVGSEISIDELYYYDGENTVYFPLNVLLEAKMHNRGFDVLLSLIDIRIALKDGAIVENDRLSEFQVERYNKISSRRGADAPISLEEIIKSKYLTEDDLLFFNEFINELSGATYDRVGTSSATTTGNKLMSSDKVGEKLKEIFEVEKEKYSIGEFALESSRFTSKGEVRVVIQDHKYYSMGEREYFFRAGDLYIIDSNFRDSIPQALFYSKAKLIFMDFRKEKMEYSINANRGHYRKGTIGMLLAMQHMDMKDKIVVDAGAGNGIIGIVAAKLGAKKVIMLEAHKEYAGLIRENAQANGVLDKLDFEYFGSAIQDIYEDKIEAKPSDYMFVNIPWWGLPKKVDFSDFKDNLAEMLLELFPTQAYITAGDEYIDGSKTKTERIFRRMGLMLQDVIELKDEFDCAPTLIFSSNRTSSNAYDRSPLKSKISFEPEISLKNINYDLPFIPAAI